MLESNQSARSVPALQENLSGEHLTLSKVLAKPLCTTISKSEVTYTVHKIGNATVKKDPYPHLYVVDIFEPLLYACMLQNLPRSLKSYARAISGSKEAKISRYTINLKSEKYTGPHSIVIVERARKREEKARPIRASPYFNVAFWKSWAQHFGGDDIKIAYLKKFEDVIRPRTNASLAHTSKKLHSRLELNRDMTGYAIGPHTDSISKWLTTLYYLPRTDSHPNMGTYAMRSRGGNQQFRSGREIWEGPDFEKVEPAPFVPNAMLSFAICQTSWHALPAMAVPFPRDMIRAFLSSEDGHASGKGPCVSAGQTIV